MTDMQLVLRSQRGDRQAFGVLASRWDKPLFRFLRRVLGDDEDARDICQDALLRAYLAIDRLREPEHFKPWVFQIALNLQRDRARSARRGVADESLESSAEGGEPAAERPDPQQEAERIDMAEILSRALARISSEQRTAILLHELHGFTSQEIGRITAVPAATVRSRIFHGLKALRRMLPQHGVTAAHLTRNGGRLS